MSKYIDGVRKNGRVLFVEPNDVFEMMNGVPMTPDYSDLCISFDLVVEVVHRFKDTSSNGIDSSGKYTLTWVDKKSLDPNNKNLRNWVSFLQGNDNHLTTFYTDTNYQDIREQTEIEGLGVDSVTVSFESYYTPTVTIKFVDQRGSALFAREEAAHSSERSTVSIDNVFGAFFTAPYPKFRLQIKGFFGKPVTYQLTCSSFKGNLNSETGNFEATVTFIAYSYSLLTDIPFQYIVAAPYCKYEGVNYWNSQVSSNPSWRTMESDKKPMPKLYEFVERINNCFKDVSLLNTESKSNIQGASDTIKTNLGEINNTIIKLFVNEDNIKPYLNDNKVNVKTINNFTGDMASLVPGDMQKGLDQQIVWISDSENIEFKDTFKDCWKTLINLIDTYNKASEKVSSNTSAIPFPYNITTAEEANSKVPKSIKLKETFVRTDDKSGMMIKNDNGTVQLNKDGIKRLRFNDNIELTDSNAAQLEQFFRTDNASASYQNYRYVYVFNIGNTYKLVSDKLSEIDRNAANAMITLEKDYQRLAKEKLGMTPYIGNIFKMIMCHIETLVHIMYKCYDNIYAQSIIKERTPDKLGINMENTDVDDRDKKGDVVPAWPLVSATDKISTIFSQEGNETIGWVGDLKSQLPWEEYKVVKAMYLACRRINSGKTMTEGPVDISYVPISPNDLNDIENVFTFSNEINADNIAWALGIRIAQLFGVFDPTVTASEAETFGVMDAYNLYLSMPTVEQITKILSEIVKTEVVEQTQNTEKEDKKETKDNKPAEDKSEDKKDDERPKNDDKKTELKVDTTKAAANLLLAMCCDDKSEIAPQSNEGDSGRKFYTFEKHMIGAINGISLSPPRNPIFKDCDSKLFYTYIFDKNYHSLIPSLINENYDNQYKFVSSGNGQSYFTTNLDSNKFYEKIYVDNTLYDVNALTFLESNEYDNYKDKTDKFYNREMFNVSDDNGIVEGIKKKYGKLKSGDIYILSTLYKSENVDKNSTDTKVGNVVKKYWKVEDDNYKNYTHPLLYGKLSESDSNGDYNITVTSSGKKPLTPQDVTTLLGTKVEKKEEKKPVDETANKKDDKVKNNPSKEKTATVDDKNKKSKEEETKNTVDNTKSSEQKVENNESTDNSPKDYVRYTPIWDSGTKMSLFGSGFYYANLANKSPYVKTLLLLYSIANVVKGKYPNFINKDKKYGTVETVSKAYIYLLGGILWRMRQDADPINNGGGKYNLGNHKEDTLFVNAEGDTYKFFVKRGNGQQNYVKITELFGGKLPDYHIQNILIEKFVSYASVCIANVIPNLEIHPSHTDEQAKQYGSMIPFEIIVETSDLKKRIQERTKQLNIEQTSGTNGANDGSTDKPSEQPTDKKEIPQANSDEAWIENFVSVLGENFRRNYYTGAVADNKGFHLFIKDDNSAQNELVNICTEQCAIIDTSHRSFGIQQTVGKSNTYTDLQISKDTAMSYLKGVTKTLEDIVNKKNVGTNTEASIQESSENTEEEEQDFTRDIAVPIYLYLKMLWDKWLCDIPKDRRNSDFYVKSFYNNFVFTDTFYRNIESRLTINCQVLLDIFDNNNFSNRDITVFKFISDLTTQHHCLFVAVPDFISGLASTSLEDDLYDEEGKRSQHESVEALKDLFKPVPYRQVDKLRNNNKFVVIYVPKLSETPSSMNGYKQDWFNVWSYNDDTDARGLNADPMYKSVTGPRLPKVLEEISLSVNTGSNGNAEAVTEGNDKPLNNLTAKGTSHTNAEVVAASIYGEYDPRRYGYYVPAFGLAYGRQNNHLFKNVQLNMETPIITSAAINTLAHIAQKGASSAHRIAYVGQDIYPVFSNYSYICEFDMMGNAQIQPLMYFQLLNVPMWRGTYMIFNVTHTMKPGDMTTHVKAMKLSNRAVPYSNAWFTKNLNYKPSELEAYLACFDQIANGGVTASNNGTTATDASGLMISGGKITNPLKLDINTNDGKSHLVLWRYAEYAGPKKGMKSTGTDRLNGDNIDGVIYDYATNEILCYVIEDKADVTANSKNYPAFYEDFDSEFVFAGDEWCTDSSEVHKGQCAYTALRRGDIDDPRFTTYNGKYGDMLALKKRPGCLFHYGADVYFSAGCFIIGSKPVNGVHKNYEKTAWYRQNIRTTTNENVVYWRKLYDYVVPKIKANPGSVILHVRKVYSQSPSVQSTGGGTSGNIPSRFVSIKKELMKAGYQPNTDFRIVPVYSTSTNFTGAPIKGYRPGQDDLWCVPQIIKTLKNAIERLRKEHPNWIINIFDAYRPKDATRAMRKWADKQNPVVGEEFISTNSVHNYGRAIDLTLYDKSQNKYVDMTNGRINATWSKETGGFDDFAPDEKPRLCNNCYPNNANKNQNYLKSLMSGLGRAGSEWWHFGLGKSGSFENTYY